jgi:hypothetical protein
VTAEAAYASRKGGARPGIEDTTRTGLVDVRWSASRSTDCSRTHRQTSRCGSKTFTIGETAEMPRKQPRSGISAMPVIPRASGWKHGCLVSPTPDRPASSTRFHVCSWRWPASLRRCSPTWSTADDMAGPWQELMLASGSTGYAERAPADGCACRLSLESTQAGESAAVAVDAVRPRRELVLENAVLRHQVNILRRRSERPKLHLIDRLRLLIGARSLPSWRRAVVLVQPETICAGGGLAPRGPCRSDAPSDPGVDRAAATQCRGGVDDRYRRRSQCSRHRLV